MRVVLATTVVMAAMAGTVAAQPQCAGMAFGTACTAPVRPNVRATFGAPFTPAPVMTPQMSPRVVPTPLPDGPWVAAMPVSAAFPSTTPAVDCAMLKHTPFTGDTKMVTQAIHPPYPDGSSVISVPSCANPTTPGPKK